MKHTKPAIKEAIGFSIVELMLTVTIIGILSSTALPSYFEHLQRSKQAVQEAQIAALMATILEFNDRTGEKASTWDELSSISAIMTNEGVASGSLTGKFITLPGAEYELEVQSTGDTTYSITASRIDKKNYFDVKSCFNISNGASAITRGNGNTSATDPICS